MRKPFPTTNDLHGIPLRDPRIQQYDWITSVRVTTDGRTIDQVLDVLRVPQQGLWSQDEFGPVYHTTEPPIDKRHWRLREFDERVWALLVGGHSPQDEVRFAAGKTAQQIADDLHAEYPDNIHAIAHTENVDAIDIVASLTRTLHHDGGARWGE